MADSAFDAREAWNWKEMEADYGPFSEEQIARLNRDRFLLVPARQKNPKRFEGDIFRKDGEWITDEMLFLFFRMSGIYLPEYREPSDARLVNPDLMLHVFHRYFEKCLEDLEKTRLAGLLEAFCAGVYENALAMRAQAPPEAGPAWDLALAQMAVPLTLAETWAPVPDSFRWRPEPEGADSLETALKNFAAREEDLPPPLREAARGALARIYAAGGPSAPDGPDPAAALGLVPAYLVPAYRVPYLPAGIDWSRFGPRSHYAYSSRLRAYLRASAWLGDLGWRRDDPKALPQIVAWAAALAGPGGPKFRKAAEGLSEGGAAVPSSPREAWAMFMDLSVFLAGPYEDPSLEEALEIATSAAGGAPPGPASPGDAAFLSAVAPAMARAAPKPGLFRAFIPERYAGLGVVTALPGRFSLPWLIATELTTEREAARRQGRDFESPFQTRFSALYVAEALGSSYADALLPREVGLHPPVAGGEGAEAGLEEGVRAMRVKSRVLQAKLASVPAEDWGRTVAGAWFGVLRALAADYPEGYPLYMRSEAYRAKQLETLLGAYTELRHDSVRYDKPNYREPGENGEEGEEQEKPPKRLVKGFVEPNLAFWESYLAALEVLSEGFAVRGLFQSDREEFGSLYQLKAYAARLGGIARREIEGAAVGEEDYEFIRTFYMGNLLYEEGIIYGERGLSGLATEIQTISPLPGGLESSESGGGVVAEALGPPHLMLVLVGSEGEQRLCAGLAFNHYEFMLPYGGRLTDAAWNIVAYSGLEMTKKLELEPYPSVYEPLPKNFWYRPALE
jgi:hypothetical protein